MEPPLDCEVLEKPCTVVLMEDENRFHATDDDKEVTTLSWLPAFQNRFPTECGMSFSSIRFPGNSNENKATILYVSDCLNALKTSSLPRIHDAVLVARGPFSSLCAQYYLESLSLLGLVMVDPILITNGENDDNEEMTRILATCNIDERDWEGFQSSSLLLEPNAVPMMVVLSSQNKAWNTASRRVAARHSDEEGLFGIVPVLDLHELSGESGNAQSEGDLMVDLVNDWIDENVL